jgi:hypothetical protein
VPELVAFRVSAKIIVVVEYQDSTIVTKCLAVEMRRREAGDPRADDNQVVVFPRVVRRDRAVEAAIACKVRGFE